MATLQKPINDLIRRACGELGIPFNQALPAYRGYWLFIKSIIESLPLEEATEEDFKELRTSINVVNLGKFYTSYDRVQRIKKSEKIIYDRTNNKKRKTST